MLLIIIYILVRDTEKNLIIKQLNLQYYKLWKTLLRKQTEKIKEGHLPQKG